MFGFGKKPKAVINISMATGHEETMSVSVNADTLDRHSIFHALNEAVCALEMRRLENNKRIMAANSKDPKVVHIDKKGRDS